MKKSNRLSSLMFCVAFTVLLFVFGIAGVRGLIVSRMNDAVSNNEWKAELGSKIETELADSFLGRTAFINGNGAVRNLLGQREMNGVVKMNNGYLLMPFEHTPEEALEQFADRTTALRDYLESQGCHLVYACAPYTVNPYAPMLPVGTEDYSNDNCDRFLELLRARQVDVIDYREEFRNDGRDLYEMMYRTDHHWTTKAGLYAYGKLEDYIVAATGCTVDPRIRDLSNYAVTTYDGWHLGSRGQRTGEIFAGGADDFDVILPTFETRLESDGRTGSFSELVLDLNALSAKDVTSRYTYDMVLNGTMGKYHNEDAHNDVRVLMIADSFGKAVNPYLILGCREFLGVENDYVSGVNAEFIEKFDPDVVILLYYPGALAEKRGRTVFDFPF